MTSRGTYISNTSNTVVQRSPGRLTGVIGLFPAGSQVRVDDTHSFGQGVLDVNATSSNTVARISGPITDINLGFNTGLVVSVTSNAQVTVLID